MKIRTMLIGSFILIGIIFMVLILKLASDDKKEWVENTAIQSKVIEIYQGYKGKPDYQIMLLDSKQRFAIPKSMLGVMQVGDSIFKKKGDDFYIFLNNKTQKKVKTGIQ